MTETVSIILAMLAQGPTEAPGAMPGFNSGLGLPSLGITIEYPGQITQPGFYMPVTTSSSSSS